MIDKAYLGRGKEAINCLTDDGGDRYKAKLAGVRGAVSIVTKNKNIILRN